MYKPIILPLAKQDIRNAATWYNSKKAGLGKRFTSEVRKVVKHLCQNPHVNAIRYGNTRCGLLATFPFMIHYTIADNEKELILSGIFHTAQSSEKWEKR